MDNGGMATSLLSSAANRILLLGDKATLKSQSVFPSDGRILISVALWFS